MKVEGKAKEGVKEDVDLEEIEVVEEVRIVKQEKKSLKEQLLEKNKVISKYKEKEKNFHKVLSEMKKHLLT